MRVSLTNRSLTQRRYPSLPNNNSFKDLDEWDGAGLANNRLNPGQQVRIDSTMLKKLMGDKIVEDRKRKLSDAEISLPLIENSFRSPVSKITSPNLFQKKTNSPQSFSPPRKQDLKGDKIQLLILLGKLKREQDIDSKPTTNTCALVEEILEILQRLDNLYKDDMQLLFKVIKDMIFCTSREIMDFIMTLTTIPVPKFGDRFSTKPYFDHLKTMKYEIETINTKAQNYKNAAELEIESLKSTVSRLENDLERLIEMNLKETTMLSNFHYEETMKKNLRIETLQQEILIKGREIQTLNELTEKNQEKMDELNNKYNREMLFSTDLQEKLHSLKNQLSKGAEIQKKQAQEIEYFTIQVQVLQDHAGDMTPRPLFDCHSILEPIGIESSQFDKLSSMHKVDLLKQKMEEKINEYSQSPLKRILKKKASFGEQNTLSIKTLKMPSSTNIKKGSIQLPSPTKINSPLRKDSKQGESLLRKNTKRVEMIKEENKSKVNESNDTNRNSEKIEDKSERESISFKKQIQSQIIDNQISRRESQKSEGKVQGFSQDLEKLGVKNRISDYLTNE